MLRICRHERNRGQPGKQDLITDVTSAMKFKDLDPILHSQLRLAVVSLLLSVKEAEFTFIREKTDATSGNLSVQINKLKEAGYIEVSKQFKDNYPQTICRITPAGVAAFEQYVKNIQSYLSIGKR